MTSLRSILEGGKGSIISVTEAISLEDTAQLAKTYGLSLFFVKGQTTTDKWSFLEQMARSLRFPAYFGNNWDALEECLTDLSWLEPSSGYLILWDDAFRLQTDHPQEFRTAMDVLASAVTHWAASNTPMYVIVLVEES